MMFRIVCLLSCIGLPAFADELEVTPSKVALNDSFAGQQLLVQLGDKDATRSASYISQNSTIASVDSAGYVSARNNGSTTITVQHQGKTTLVPVTVVGVGNGRAIDFRTEIMPLLSKHGCNAGGCHGKASGQNGFKLSLFGFDTPFDYDAIVKEARGRRVLASAPEGSLFLQKASGTVPHGGGKKLAKDTADYQTIRQWLAVGAPATATNAPKVKRLRVLPEERVLAPQSHQQLAVVAEYTDGSTRDVTRQAEFFSNLDVIAAVNAEGYVTTGGQSGEATIMARHMGFVATFRAMIPHGPPLKEIPDFSPLNLVDEFTVAKWKKLGLKPSAVVNDATFIRRITIDLCGRLPTPEEVKVFLADASPNKRAKWAQRLLDSGDYPAYFAMKWGSILRNSNLAGADRAAVAFHHWIKDHLARNTPYDEFVRGIVAASGEWQDSPAINWYWQNRDDRLHQPTADVAQIFLGTRLQCAKCHHHPYERWGQADYYGLAGFFARVGGKSFGEPPPVYAAAQPTTSEKNPVTGKAIEPKYLDGDEPKFTAEDDPRHALVDWMAKPDNPFFAKAFVNRVWGHFFGRGLVHEVDDQRETNPPSNPELLDALAKEFIKNKFDMKKIILLLVSSRVYQLSSEPTEFNKNDRQNFARYYARRLPAEVLHDAVVYLTGAKTGFSGVGDKARAIDLPHEGFGSYFLDTFDRPKRVTVCECERSTSATLGQVLLLANSDEIEGKIASGEGRLAKLLKAKKSTTDIVADLYLNAYARTPTPTEMKRILDHVATYQDPQQGLEDVLWTILNSKEFMFNR